MLKQLSAGFRPLWLDQALQWWVSDIREFFSPRLLNLLVVPRYEITLEFNESILRAKDTVSGAQTILPDEETQQRYLRKNCGNGSFVQRLQRPYVRLRIAHDKCLARELTVPATNRTQAMRIAELQGRASLPFEPDQVACAHAVTDLKNGSLLLRTIIVKRSTLQHHLEVLTRAGCKPDIVDGADAWGHDYGVNLLNADQSRGVAGLIVPALFVLALLLPLIALQVEWSKRTNALAKLDLEIADVKAKVDSLLKKSAEVNAVADAVTALRRKRVSELTIVELWDELSRVLPDNAWISQMQVTKSKVSISGFASEAAPLVGTLETEPLFKQVTFTSPVSYDPSALAERFAIGFEIDSVRPAAGLAEQKASP
jgi:general secretion pathway protein L